MQGLCKEKNRTLSQLGAVKIAFLPKSDEQTEIRTDISTYKKKVYK